MTKMPEKGSRWRRKSDGRIDRVVDHDGARFIEMYSDVTGLHWSIEDFGLYRKYEPATAKEAPAS